MSWKILALRRSARSIGECFGCSWLTVKGFSSSERRSVEDLCVSGDGESSVEDLCVSGDGESSVEDLCVSGDGESSVEELCVSGDGESSGEDLCVSGARYVYGESSVQDLPVPEGEEYLVLAEMQLAALPIVNLVFSLTARH